MPKADGGLWRCQMERSRQDGLVECASRCLLVPDMGVGEAANRQEYHQPAHGPESSSSSLSSSQPDAVVPSASFAPHQSPLQRPGSPAATLPEPKSLQAARQRRLCALLSLAGLPRDALPLSPV